jgi:hypothetical protein
MLADKVEAAALKVFTGKCVAFIWGNVQNLNVARDLARHSADWQIRESVLSVIHGYIGDRVWFQVRSQVRERVHAQVQSEVYKGEQ